MRVDPQGDGRAGVAEPSGDDVDRYLFEQERGCVDVPQVVEQSDGSGVEADAAVAAALGGSIDPLPVDDAGGAPNMHGAAIEVEVGPPEVEKLSPAGAGERCRGVERAVPVLAGRGQARP